MVPLHFFKSATLIWSDRTCHGGLFPQCLGGPCRDWGIQDGDSFVVSGSLPQLGNWQQDQPLLLSESQMPFWETEVHTYWALTTIWSLLRVKVNLFIGFYISSGLREVYTSSKSLQNFGLQVRTPLKNFPITYKYGLRRKNGDLELEVSSSVVIFPAAPCAQLACLCRGHTCAFRCG